MVILFCRKKKEKKFFQTVFCFLLFFFSVVPMSKCLLPIFSAKTFIFSFTSKYQPKSSDPMGMPIKAKNLTYFSFSSSSSSFYVTFWWENIIRKAKAVYGDRR